MSKRLYVGNLSYDTSEDKLREVFSEHGEVVDVALITDRYTGRSRGFAFVEMATDEQAEEAINTLNGKTVDGRDLRVAEAKQREDREGGGGQRRSSQREDRW
ncbi:MAG: RNA recognition motif domain-containing protein [Anaerolineales bacterium]